MISTCRDPGSAISMAPVLSQLQKINEIELKVFAQNPAYEIYKNNTGLSEVDIEYIDILSAKQLMETAVKILDDFQPLAVFSGISSPDAGIDESMLKAAGQANIKRISFQDYWGYLNPEAAQSHDIIIVIDDYAKMKTAEISSARIDILGNPRHDHYQSLKASSLNRAFRVRYNIEDESFVLGFVGQPLGSLQGYINTVSALSKAMAKINKNIHCIYRPHPKEDLELQKTIGAILKQSNCAFGKQNNVEPIEELFAGSDVLAMLFSSAGYDAQLMNSHSDMALASTFYMMFDQSIIDFFQSNNIIQDIPFSEPPFAKTISKVENLMSCLDECLTSKTKNLRHHHIRKTFQHPETSSDLMVKLILQELKS